jgi:hypothetical protein
MNRPNICLYVAHTLGVVFISQYGQISIISISGLKFGVIYPGRIILGELGDFWGYYSPGFLIVIIIWLSDSDLSDFHIFFFLAVFPKLRQFPVFGCSV